LIKWSKIPLILWNHQVHYRFHKSLPLDPLPSQSNPDDNPLIKAYFCFHVCLPHFCKRLRLPYKCIFHYSIRLIPSSLNTSSWFVSNKGFPECKIMHHDVRWIINQTPPPKKKYPGSLCLNFNHPPYASCVAGCMLLILNENIKLFYLCERSGNVHMSYTPLIQLGTGHDGSSSTCTTLKHTITSFVSLHLIG